MNVTGKDARGEITMHNPFRSFIDNMKADITADIMREAEIDYETDPSFDLNTIEESMDNKNIFQLLQIRREWYERE